MRNRAGRRDKNLGYRSIGAPRLPRSAFDLSFAHKTTAEPSLLLPLYVQECMPADTIQCRPKIFLRQLSSVFPVMDGIRVEMQFFFVNNRIIMGEEWRKLMGERVDPTDHNDYMTPTVTAPAGGFAKQSLWDYLGLPTEIAGIKANSLPARAAALCWNEWYRDQNLQDSLDIPTGEGDDDPALACFELQHRGKPKDRFGGALPQAQKGPSVQLPLGQTAPVVPDSTDPTPSVSWNDAGELRNLQVDNAGNIEVAGSTFPASTTSMQWTYSGLEVDLDKATAATINQMREAIALQQLFERDNLGGSRYAEGIYAHFGVRMPDARYRPVLISSSTADVISVEIPNVNPTSTADGEVYFLGRQGAQMKGGGALRPWSYSADEWGWIIGFLTIRSEISYSQGIPAHFWRRTRVDHYMPDLALLGEESIPVGEIYADGTGDPDALTGDYAPWGFTPRYESYRHRVNMISGELRSNGAAEEFGRLDRWHYGLDFASRPALNADFIKDDPNPIQRNTLHTLAPSFIVDCEFHQTGVRPMPKIARPGLLRF